MAQQPRSAGHSMVVHPKPFPEPPGVRKKKSLPHVIFLIVD